MTLVAGYVRARAARAHYFHVTTPLPYTALGDFVPCPACGSRDYWLASDGTWRCGGCELCPDPPRDAIRVTLAPAAQ